MYNQRKTMLDQTGNNEEIISHSAGSDSTRLTRHPCLLLQSLSRIVASRVCELIEAQASERDTLHLQWSLWFLTCLLHYSLPPHFLRTPINYHSDHRKLANGSTEASSAATTTLKLRSRTPTISRPWLGEIQWTWEPFGRCI